MVKQPTNIQIQIQSHTIYKHTNTWSNNLQTYKYKYRVKQPTNVQIYCQIVQTYEHKYKHIVKSVCILKILISLDSFTVATMTWLTSMEYLCHK